MSLNIKEHITYFIDYIDQKLQTKEGRLALIIAGSLVTGGAIIHAYNKDTAYTELLITKTQLETKYGVLEATYTAKIQSADSDCNKKIREGAILHQQLQQIYKEKITKNIEFVKEQAIIEEQKKQIIKVQNKNLKELNRLTQ